MTPDDPRHGQRAGYNAGCRDSCCRPHHLRYQKMSQLRRHREGIQWVDPRPVLDFLDKWRDYGVSPNAVARAAGASEATLRRVIHEGSRVTRDTERRVLAVTWDDLPDNAMVNGDLTRLRIKSMQAAGFPITWICDRVPGLTWNGNWRKAERMQLSIARHVQALYESLPMRGPSEQAAKQARHRGYPVPAAWDDPGLPSMPPTWRPHFDRLTSANARPAKSDVDEAVVLRVMAGERLPMTTGERVEVVARLRARGWSLNEITMHTGIGKADRYTKRGAA